VVRDLAEMGIRSYVSEPRRRGRRAWRGQAAERDAVYGNRRRIKAERGRALLRRRGEVIERSFAHAYETGAMRRTHLRGHEKILKRLCLHIAGFNLSLVLRKLFGVGTPRGLQDLPAALARALFGAVLALRRVCAAAWAVICSSETSSDHDTPLLRAA